MDCFFFHKGPGRVFFTRGGSRWWVCGIPIFLVHLSRGDALWALFLFVSLKFFSRELPATRNAEDKSVKVLRSRDWAYIFGSIYLGSLKAACYKKNGNMFFMDTGNFHISFKILLEMLLFFTSLANASESNTHSSQIFSECPKSRMPAPLSFKREMLAGAVARASAQCIMYPAEVMKTLAQARTTRAGLSIWEMGIDKLISGAITTSILALPAGALQMGIFPWAKQHARELAPAWLSPAALELFAAAVASFVACFVQTPQEVVKSRLQTGMYKSFWSGISSIAREQGLRGFYTAFGPTVARNTPTVCISFTAFSRLKEAYKASVGAPPNGLANAVLGAAAAGIAVLLTQPIDVIKTRLMTEEASKFAAYTGAIDCFFRMVGEEGASSLFKGLLPRLLYVAPFGAIQFAVNEQLRILLMPAAPCLSLATPPPHADL